MHIRKQEHFLLNWKQDGGMSMTEAERQLLQDFAQTRIESHFSRYRDNLSPGAIQAEEALYDRFRALCAGLPEEDRKVAEDYDKFMFQSIADKEQLMYYTGFRDGIRAARLFHEIENEPLSE